MAATFPSLGGRGSVPGVPPGGSGGIKKRHNFAKTLFSVFITFEELCFREKKSFKIMQSSGKITIIFGKVIELVLIDS